MKLTHIEKLVARTVEVLENSGPPDGAERHRGPTAVTHNEPSAYIPWEFVLFQPAIREDRAVRSGLVADKARVMIVTMINHCALRAP